MTAVIFNKSKTAHFYGTECKTYDITHSLTHNYFK